MQIHVARKSTQLGVFSAEEITEGLATGRFVATDLAWREGMASWLALGEWAEFRGVGAPASASVAGTDGVVPASTVPWEQGKSLGSFFATIKGAIISPRETLAVGRYQFGDWLVFCYVALALSFPFQIVGQLLKGDKNKEWAEMIRSLKIPQLNELADQLANQPPTTLLVTMIVLILGVVLGPFFYAATGVIHWLGQKAFRYPVSIERTVAATLLAMGVLVVLMIPTQLLGASRMAQLLLGGVLFIYGCVVYYRAFGAATGISPWMQFGISCVVWLVLCCCCCLLPTVAIGGIAGVAAGLK